RAGIMLPGDVGVAGARTNNVGQFETFALQCGCHHIGSLLLFIDFPAVSDRGQVVQIHSVIGAVVPMPELLLPGWWRDRFTLKNPKKFLCFRKSRAGRRRSPLARIMDGKLPAGSSAHRETTNDDSIVVDMIALFHFSEGFEQINLAGKLVRVTETAVE